MSTRIPQCSLCKHFQDGPYPGTCAAFPDGIPEKVYWGYVDHRLPYPGDNGVGFELSEEAKRFPLSLWADLPPIEDSESDKVLPSDTAQAQPEEQSPVQANGVPAGVKPSPVKRRKSR